MMSAGAPGPGREGRDLHQEQAVPAAERRDPRKDSAAPYRRHDLPVRDDPSSSSTARCGDTAALHPNRVPTLSMEAGSRRATTEEIPAAATAAWSPMPCLTPAARATLAPSNSHSLAPTPVCTGFT